MRVLPHWLCRDLPLLTDAATINASFNALPKEANGFPANKTLQAFIAANFGAAGSDFESAVPDDFSSEPEDFLPNVTDPAIRQWALQVNDLWQDLCREVRLPPLSGLEKGEGVRGGLLQCSLSGVKEGGRVGGVTGSVTGRVGEEGTQDCPRLAG